MLPLSESFTNDVLWIFAVVVMAIDAASFPKSNGVSGHMAVHVGIPAVLSQVAWGGLGCGRVYNPHPGLYITFALGESKWVDSVMCGVVLGVSLLLSLLSYSSWKEALAGMQAQPSHTHWRHGLQANGAGFQAADCGEVCQRLLLQSPQSWRNLCVWNGGHATFLNAAGVAAALYQVVTRGL